MTFNKRVPIPEIDLTPIYSREKAPTHKKVRSGPVLFVRPKNCSSLGWYDFQSKTFAYSDESQMPFFIVGKCMKLIIITERKHLLYTRILIN